MNKGCELRLLAVAVAAALASADLAAQQLEEIYVTGSRISREGFDAPTPVTAIDNQYMLELGFVNVGAAVQQMPINKASLTPETNGFGSFLKHYGHAMVGEGRRQEGEQRTARRTWRTAARQHRVRAGGRFPALRSQSSARLGGSRIRDAGYCHAMY